MEFFEKSDTGDAAGTPPAGQVQATGGLSLHRSGDTSAIRALETIIEPGTEIDRFMVGKMLGRGSIAAVYAGTDSETNEPLVLKVLDVRRTTDKALVERFHAEAQTLARFHHPNIVRHIAHGRDDSFVYIAMEQVDGVSLEQLISTVPLEVRHYVQLAQELGKGLTAIHAGGLRHGDIKPSNILVSRSGDVKITDFGTAGGVLEPAEHTAGSRVSGTRPYIAPELLQAEAPVDFRADIYSLGITFYRMLTGGLPAPDEPARPSLANDALPPEIDDVIERALRHNPEERYATARELCDAVAAVFDEEKRTAGASPVPISPDPVQHRNALEESRMQAARQAAEQRAHTDWELIVICLVVIVTLAVAIVLVVVVM